MENSPGPPEKKRNPNSLKIYAKYSAIGFQMAAIILLGLWGGMKLDDLLELSYPVFTIILTFLSFAAAMYYLFRGIARN